ncbi:MAG TPA: cytochrome c [Acidimicrobiales bacterium]|nr:cytochrome c [Acidimicrobiales bacterium]
MTEVPEYLLRRSRERREALGLAPKGGGGSDSPAEGEGSAPAAASPATTPVSAETPAPVAAAVTASAPAAVAVADRGPRSGVPYWMMPVLIILPIWAFLYLGSFGSKGNVVLTPAQVGAKVYTTNCSTCHGAKGEGGVGPALAGGDAKVTFPNEADHIAWVETGSAPHKGQPYGDPARAGGQRVAASGGMPGFKGPLTDAEIAAVVAYERESL